MALMDLRSNLSWYSSNGKPPGYAPNPNVQSTNFQYNEDLTVSAQPRGYDDKGNAIKFIPRTSANEFFIDNNSTSFRGNATRLSQLGNGSKFPIGPQGQVFDFDKQRIGFHQTARYTDTYNALSTSGLADTYTLKKPLDSMYNKFKVREQAYNPYGDPAPPFILRGIQRDDSIDPERYGNTGFTPDIPRGGLITAQQRAKLDYERLSKFLARPAGQWFITKQNLLHLMYPNREGVDGRPQTPAWNANTPKVFVPQNLLDQVGLNYTGTHNRKHGQFPYDTPGFLPFPPSPPSNYEQIHKERAVGQTQDGRTVDPSENNRLVLIYRDSIRDKKKGWIPGPAIGESFTKLTDRLGPNSISFDGSIQETAIRRWSITTPDPNREIPVGSKFGEVVSLKFSEIRDREYSYTNPYRSRTLSDTDFGIQLGAEKRTTETPAPYKFRDSLIRKYILLLNNGDWNAHQNDRDVLKPPTDDTRSKRTWIQTTVGGQLQTVKPDVRPDSYELIQKGNDLRSNAGPYKSKIVDFRATFNTNGEIQSPYNAFAIDTDTTEAARTKRTEAMLTRLREEAVSENRFNGAGDSERAKADNTITEINAPGTFNRNDGTSETVPAYTAYYNIGIAAQNRRNYKNTDIDFRKFPNGEQYDTYVGNTTADDGTTDVAVTRIGFNDPTKAVPDRNPATPAQPDAGMISLQKYKTMTYGEIRQTAKKRELNYKNPQIVDFRKAGESFDAGNDKVANSELITFKIGDITFPAYIISISDSFNAGLTPESDQNRADPRYLYTSFERSVGISFMAVYEKSSQSPWNKLKQLASYTLPGYSSGPWAQAPKVTIGKLYRNIPMLIESVSYDWDNETPWSIAGNMGRDNQFKIDSKNDGLPMYTTVDLQMKYLGNVKPAAGSGYVAYGS